MTQFEGQHHKIEELEGMEHLRLLFADGEADSLNWCFIGTSGIHGTYTKLNEYPEFEEFTVLVLQPRRVTSYYGNVTVQDEQDLKFLKQLVETTIDVIEETQSENL